jgi:hypothetical protein
MNGHSFPEKLPVVTPARIKGRGTVLVVEDQLALYANGY